MQVTPRSLVPFSGLRSLAHARVLSMDKSTVLTIEDLVDKRAEHFYSEPPQKITALTALGKLFLWEKSHSKLKN